MSAAVADVTIAVTASLAGGGCSCRCSDWCDDDYGGCFAAVLGIVVDGGATLDVDVFVVPAPAAGLFLFRVVALLLCPQNWLL